MPGDRFSPKGQHGRAIHNTRDRQSESGLERRRKWTNTIERGIPGARCSSLACEERVPVDLNACDSEASKECTQSITCSQPICR